MEKEKVFSYNKESLLQFTVINNSCSPILISEDKLITKGVLLFWNAPPDSIDSITN